ncbi:hypothetical protein [Rhizobium binxianense]
MVGDLLGEMRLLNLRLNEIEKRPVPQARQPHIAVWLAVIAILVAVAAFGGQWLASSTDAAQLSARAAAQSAIQDFVPWADSLKSSNEVLSTKVDHLDERIGRLVKTMNEKLPPRPSPYQTPNR